MTTHDSKEILTDDESSIIELLQSIDFEEADFHDPENGDFLDRMETLLSAAKELDATVVKIAIDRVHFFIGQGSESTFTDDSFEDDPETSEEAERLKQALDPARVIDSGGAKSKILEIVARLQSDYLWGDSDNPNPEILRELSSLLTAHRVEDAMLLEFVNDNILFPWNEYIGVQFNEVSEDNEYFEWYEQCKSMPGNTHAGVILN